MLPLPQDVEIIPPEMHIDVLHEVVDEIPGRRRCRQHDRTQERTVAGDELPRCPVSVSQQCSDQRSLPFGARRLCILGARPRRGGMAWCMAWEGLRFQFGLCGMNVRLGSSPSSKLEG